MINTRGKRHKELLILCCKTRCFTNAITDFMFLTYALKSIYILTSIDVFKNILFC